MNCPMSYIGETARPLYVQLKNHRFETTKILQGWAYTRNKGKESTDTDYKSALAEHAPTSNHVIDWDNVKVIKLEQNWRWWVSRRLSIAAITCIPQQITRG